MRIQNIRLVENGRKGRHSLPLLVLSLVFELLRSVGAQFASLDLGTMLARLFLCKPGDLPHDYKAQVSDDTHEGNREDMKKYIILRDRHFVWFQNLQYDQIYPLLKPSEAPRES